MSSNLQTELEAVGPRKKRRQPQLWATRLAEVIYRDVRAGYSLPYILDGITGESNGESIRVLQEVGFAKTFLDARGGQHSISWSLKRILQNDGTYRYQVGMQTSGGRNRGAGKMDQKFEGWLTTKENMPVSSSSSEPTPPKTQEPDPIADAIRSQYGDIL